MVKRASCTVLPLAIAFALLSPPLVFGSTFRPMSVGELTLESDAVIEGTVISVRSFWNEEHTLILTEAEVRVARHVRGETPDKITVQTLGGTVDGYTILAEGFPAFAVHEQVMLFLSATGERFQVTGHQFGHYRLLPGADGKQVAFPTLDLAPGQRRPEDVRPHDIDELRALVRHSALEARLRKTQEPFSILSPRRTWDLPPVLIVDDRGISSINDGSNGVTRAVNAINSTEGWNGTCAGIVVAAVAGSVANFTLGDGIPMINFQDPVGFCTGNCLAATFLGFFSQRPDGTFRIDDADTVFNSSAFDWTSEGEDPGGCGCDDEAYIESQVVHEVGHVLGLAHTDVTGATMFPSVTFCDNSQATIEADDRAGIIELYGH